MPTIVPVTEPKSEAARQQRLEWEAKCIAEAFADLKAGRLIDGADIHAWIDSTGTDREVPPPRYPGEPDGSATACRES